MPLHLEETNIVTKHNGLKCPNCREADQLATNMNEELNHGLPRLSGQSGTSEIITRPRCLLYSLLKDINLLYSGAGKTTLMNVLAHGNISQMEVSGTVEVNDHPVGLQINTMSAYIQQEDLFIGSLTVREHLTFQVSLA